MQSVGAAWLMTSLSSSPLEIALIQTASALPFFLSPGIYVETFLVDSWAEHQRQHDRFTIADRTIEDQVFRFAREPVRIRHFIYAKTSRHR
jgi:hypothetical protein